MHADLSADIRQLYERLGVESAGEHQASAVEFHPDIFLVASVDDLTQRWKNVRSSTTITANGFQLAATVPAGKRWTVQIIHVVRTSGTFTHEGLQVNDASEGIKVQYPGWTAGTDHTVEPYNRITMDELDEIYINIGSHSVNGNLNLNMLLQEHDIS
tara:strand:- start:308 stop:778 length:471 start_codon:yes stop_codon:yes gene_type:complete